MSLKKVIKIFISSTKTGEWYYFEVRSAWRGKHIIRVKDGLLGWRKEIVTE
ncbi:hypothetical protein [Staphylococcus aureus]|uniref:hypothetical protein n=1 Tax=Staphylococcus aureus TaxID=1280 RepID=UPI0015F156EE|nr:hypothetical protein [Staphylococcus aureus]